MEAASNSQTNEVQELFQQSEFLAEDELIEITPMIRSEAISLLRGTFGPFEPSVSTKVPLWLALSLKKIRRCKILPPKWFTERSLQRFVADEKDNDNELLNIPFFFFEISSLLLHHASDDIEDASKLRRYVEDLSNVRDSKMRRWMQEHVRDRVNAVKINNLSMHEINAHRPTLTRVLGSLYTLYVDPDTTNVLSQSEHNTNSVTASESDSAPPQGRQLRRVLRRT